MGPLGKYAAYRWISAGDGDGSGGNPDLGVVILVFVGIGVVLFAFAAGLSALSVVASTIYDTLRPVMIRAPTASSILGGLLLASLVLVIGPYSWDTARELLTGRHPDSTVSGTAGDTVGFYIRNLAVIGFLSGYVALGVPVGNDLVALLDGVLPEFALFFPLVMLVSTVALFYTLYKIFHLPYRYVRLLRLAPRGAVATVVMVLPVTATVVGEAFDLPFLGVESHTAGVAFLLVPYVGGLLLVKILAEPHVLGAGSTAFNRSD